jgi:hypothetical protein
MRGLLNAVGAVAVLVAGLPSGDYEKLNSVEGSMIASDGSSAPLDVGTTGWQFNGEVELANGGVVFACSQAAISTDDFIPPSNPYVYHFSINSAPPEWIGACELPVFSELPEAYLTSEMWGFVEGVLGCTNYAENSAGTGSIDSSLQCPYPMWTLIAQFYTWGRQGWFMGNNCTPEDECVNGYTLSNISISPIVGS